MKSMFSKVDKILFVSVGFTLILLAVRIVYTHKLDYGFYPWNLCLALLPLLFSRKLTRLKQFGLKAFCYLSIWLLFFPNAPYLLTDLFHFSERQGCPAWFDLILVSSASWNGIAVVMISLLQVENFLGKFFSHIKVRMMLLTFIILSGYGVYLGRYLRFNSWDIVVNPVDLAYYIAGSLIHPHQNLSLWVFTMAFSFLLALIFFLIKGLNEGKEAS